MKFSTYAVTLITATAVVIPTGLFLAGTWDFVPSFGTAIVDLALGLLIRGYTLGNLPGYTFDGGHWTLKA